MDQGDGGVNVTATSTFIAYPMVDGGSLSCCVQKCPTLSNYDMILIVLSWNLRNVQMAFVLLRTTLLCVTDKHAIH